MTPRPPCDCTRSTIDGHDIIDLPTWELALRNAAHGHYPILTPKLLVHAVREIDRLRAYEAGP